METEVIANDVDRVRQAPSDVLRMVVAILALLAAELVALLFGNAVVGFAEDLLRGLDQLPSAFFEALKVLSELLAVVLIVGGLVAVVRRRAWLVLGASIAAAALAAVLAAITAEVGSDAERSLTGAGASGISGDSLAASSAELAALAAVVTATAPWLPRTWRRVAWALVMLVAVIHFTSLPVAFSTLIGLLSGWAAGSVVVVVLGAPSRRPTGRAIAEGLAAVGVPLATLEQASLDARGSTPYFGTTPDGSKLFVKALGADERGADLMFRAYRRLQPRDLGDEKSFSSLRRAVEHEAFVSLSARELGVKTPRLAAFATAQPEGFVLAYDAIDGRSLDRLDVDEVTDEVLDLVWAQLSLMRRHRVAHRDLRLANVFVAADGDAWIIDFGFSEMAASDLLLATDLAELMASVATVVGVERSVAAGRRALGGDALRSALPRLQLPMLSGATRSALKEQPGRLDELKAAIAAV